MVLTKEQIEKWYKSQAWEKDWVADAVATGTITPEEYLAITGEEYTDSSAPPKPVKNLVAEKLTAEDATFTGDVKIKGGKPVLTVAQSLTPAEQLQARLNIGIANEKRVCYGFHVNGSESNPENMITYVADAVGMTPAKMDFEQSKFNWGSWQNAFFMPKPCMLKYDGKVAYFLNPDDYTQKLGGGKSDVDNDDFEGNAMMQWPLIWWKVVPDAEDSSSATIYIANYKVDEGFNAWSNINSKGQLIPYFYTPIYNGTQVGTRLRSLSGNKLVLNKQTANKEVELAKANNVTTATEWWTEVYADNILIEFLGMLIGKSMNTQATFGRGCDTMLEAGVYENTSYLRTGTGDKKGMFWGENTTGKSVVKFFGMENFWASSWRRYAGHVLAAGEEKVKLTWGTEDGSTTIGYNFTGEGYIPTGRTKDEVASGNGYTKTMHFSKYGMCPQVAVGGSATTYYSDYFWWNNADVRYAIRGGSSNFGAYCGLFCLALYDLVSLTYWDCGAAVSCKPLA